MQWPTQWSQRVTRQERSAVLPPELQQCSHAGRYQGPAMCSSSCPLYGQIESRARQQRSYWSCILVLGFGVSDWSGAVPRVWIWSRLMTSMDAVPLTWGDCFWDRCEWNGTGGGPDLGTGGTATTKSESKGSREKWRSPPLWSCFMLSSRFSLTVVSLLVISLSHCCKIQLSINRLLQAYRIIPNPFLTVYTKPTKRQPRPGLSAWWWRFVQKRSQNSQNDERTFIFMPATWHMNRSWTLILRSSPQPTRWKKKHLPFGVYLMSFLWRIARLYICVSRHALRGRKSHEQMRSKDGLSVKECQCNLKLEPASALLEFLFHQSPDSHDVPFRTFRTGLVLPIGGSWPDSITMYHDAITRSSLRKVFSVGL